MAHWKFWFSNRQLEMKDEELAEYYRYKQLSPQQKAALYPTPEWSMLLVPHRPHVNFVVGTIGGESVEIAYTEMCDADKYPEHNSYANDAVLVYECVTEGTSYPRIRAKDYTPELAESLMVQ